MSRITEHILASEDYSMCWEKKNNLKAIDGWPNLYGLSCNLKPNLFL